MAFLTLTSEVSQPFIIPSLSPVSQPSSRKNSDATVNDIDEIDRLLSSGNLNALQGSAIVDAIYDANNSVQHSRNV